MEKSRLGRNPGSINSEIAKELKFFRDPLNSANPGPFSLESLWKKSPDFPRRRKLLSVSVSRQLYFTSLLSMDRLSLGPSSECKLLASLAWLQVWCVLLGEACIGKLAYLFPRVEGMSNSCFVVICFNPTENRSVFTAHRNSAICSDCKKN